MATLICWNFTDGTIPVVEWAKSVSLSGRERRLCSEPSEQTPCLFGVDSSTMADNKESTAPYSETKDATDQANSFDKRAQLLIASGLIAGITPTSIRKRYGQAILDFASSRQDGGAADEPKAD